MRIAAQTKFSDVIDAINALLYKGEYANRNDFAMRAILRECNRVRDAEPSLGWSLLGCYHSLLGEAEEVDRCFRASQDLGSIPVACDNYHTNLTNLGYFSRAHEFFRTRGHPEGGMFTRMASVAFTSGSIQTFSSFYEKAVAMNIEMPTLPVAKAIRASAVLSAAGVTDEDITRHLDAAGVVLRRHRIFFEDEGEVEVADEPGLFNGVTCIFRLHRSAEEVFDLNMELALAEEEMAIEKSPAFDVLFLSV
jgi:hypothetical protein